MSLSDALFFDPYRTNVFVAARTDGARGTGTVSDPWNGTGAANFDDIFAGRVPALSNPNVQINIGPGTFDTGGYSEMADGSSASGWSLRANWKIVGSGIDATKIRINPASFTTGNYYFAFGHQLPSGGSGNRVDLLSISECPYPISQGDIPERGRGAPSEHAKIAENGRRSARKRSPDSQGIF